MSDSERVARIYTLSDPRTSEVRYVGVTTRSLSARLSQHLSDGRRANTRRADHRTRWIRSLINVGIAPAIAEIDVVSIAEHGDAERRWIATYRAAGVRLTNSTEGGPGTLGLKVSAETRELIRRAAVERMRDPARREAVSRVHKGKTLPEAIRKACSERATQRWIAWRAAGGITSDETRARLKAAAKARPFKQPMNNPEARAKVAEAKRLWWEEWRKAGVGRKTHCPQDHPYDETNTYVERDGSRKCRTCKRERARAAREARLKP